MNIYVYARHHFSGAVLDRLESSFQDHNAPDLEKIRVANIIKDGNNWWCVLYKGGYQYAILPVSQESLVPPPEPSKEAA